MSHQNHPLNPHHPSPSLQRLDILILHFGRLFRELWPRTLPEAEQINRIDGSILRETVKVEDPEADSRAETVQQYDGCVVTKRVDGERPNFILHAHTIANVDVELVMC